MANKRKVKEQQERIQRKVANPHDPGDPRWTQQWLNRQQQKKRRARIYAK
jgi:hypothetical protein